MELAEEKEEEARRLRNGYIDQLQMKTSQVEAAAREEQLVRQQLRADFEYNLHLMEERDRELAAYEAAVQEMREAVNHLTAENSELQVALAERESCSVRERESHRKKIAALQAEMVEWRRGLSEEVESERRRCEDVRRELERRVREVEGEEERVRLELTAHYEEEHRKTQQQHRAQVEQLEGTVLECQSQLRASARETDSLTHRLLSTQDEAKCLRERGKELETQMKAQEWAWQDRLVCLETELGQVQSEMEHKLTVYTSSHAHLDNKCSELDRQVREKTACLQTARECWKERESDLEHQVREMKCEVERVRAEEREETGVFEDQLREKNQLIERLQTEVQEVKRGAGKIETMLSDTAAELQLAEREIKHLKAALTSATTQLHHSEERARAKADEMEGEWRERVREAERRSSARMQTAFKTLTQDRDQMLSEVHNLKERLSQQQKALDEVTRERYVAIATLNSSSVSEVKGQPSREVLTQQNQQLRTAIESMRRALEQLTRGGGRGQPEEGCGHGYIQYLEKELVRIKNEKRKLMSESKPPSGRLLREKTAAEMRAVWLQNTLATTQARLRETEEEVYQLRAVQVSPEKCQKKLLQATRSIISLLRERDRLLGSLVREGGRRGEEEERTEGTPPQPPPQPPEHSLSTLHFTDSEVEGQRSLDKLLLMDSLSTSPPPPMAPSSPPLLEMKGQSVKPVPRKPRNSMATVASKKHFPK